MTSHPDILTTADGNHTTAWATRPPRPGDDPCRCGQPATTILRTHDVGDIPACDQALKRQPCAQPS